jgi:hypothetical protein
MTRDEMIIHLTSQRVLKVVKRLDATTLRDDFDSTLILEEKERVEIVLDAVIELHGRG